MRYWLIVISAMVAVIIVSCTDSPVSDEPDQGEIAREVNWALLELNNLEAVREVYWQNYGEDPDSIAQLYPYLDTCFYQWDGVPASPDSAYTAIMPSYKWWQFGMVASGDTIHQFTATSTAEMVGGAGHVLTYNVVSGIYDGYGMDAANPMLFAYLLGRFINPLLIFETSATFDLHEARRRMEIVREVNAAAESFMGLKGSIIMFVNDYGEPPDSYVQLDTLEYISLPPAFTEWWQFAFELRYVTGSRWDIIKLHAIATDEMAGGGGDTLTYFPGRYWYGDFGRWEYIGKWARWKSPFVGP
jgi:hypothetical protein